MARIPALPDKTTLPLDKPFSLGGLSVHAHWMGGVGLGDQFSGMRYGFAFKNWDLYHGGPVDYAPDNDYVAGPDTGISVRAFFTGMQGWNFFSPLGDSNDYRTRLPMTLPLDQDPYVIGPPLGVFMNNFQPWPQHYVLARSTHTVASDGFPPIWQNGETTESVSQITHYAHWNTILIVIDGTGSFGSGSDADAHLHALFTSIEANGNGSAKVIATKFSDYPSRFADPTDVDDEPSYLLGTWTNTSDAVAGAVMAASDAHDTGNGGDTNESQFEGIQLGLLKAAELGWDTGPRAVIVYTDAASVCLFGSAAKSAMRLNQRDDGLGVSGHARLNGVGAPNSSTSVQTSAAPRVPQGPNTYS